MLSPLARWSQFLHLCFACAASAYFRYAAKVSKGASKEGRKPFGAVSLPPLKPSYLSTDRGTPPHGKRAVSYVCEGIKLIPATLATLWVETLTPRGLPKRNRYGKVPRSKCALRICEKTELRTCRRTLPAANIAGNSLRTRKHKRLWREPRTFLRALPGAATPAGAARTKIIIYDIFRRSRSGMHGTAAQATSASQADAGMSCLTSTAGVSPPI